MLSADVPCGSWAPQESKEVSTHVGLYSARGLSPWLQLTTHRGSSRERWQCPGGH